MPRISLALVRLLLGYAIVLIHNLRFYFTEADPNTDRDIYIGLLAVHKTFEKMTDVENTPYSGVFSSC